MEEVEEREMGDRERKREALAPDILRKSRCL